VIPAAEALERLRAGNHRFAAGLRSREDGTGRARRGELTMAQEPFAIILGCSDSRVPAEIVFDQGLGDLFVIRVAGNVVAPSQIGSVEFAAERFGTALVVVLGHTSCGAVQATLEELERPAENQSRNLRSIVERIQPALEALIRATPRLDSEALAREAVRANVRASVRALSHGSEIIERFVRDGRLLVVGAEYALDSGEVEFLDVGGGL
jgi:carbonic anhydrase